MKKLSLLAVLFVFTLRADDPLLMQINELLKDIEFSEKFVNPGDAEHFSSLITRKSYQFMVDTSSFLRIKENVTEIRSTPFFTALSSTQEFEYQINPLELHVDNIGVSSWSWGGQGSLFYVFVRCLGNKLCVRKSSTDWEKEHTNCINSFELRIESGEDGEKAHHLRAILHRFLYAVTGKKWQNKENEEDDFGIYWNLEPDDADDFNPLY